MSEQENFYRRQNTNWKMGAVKEMGPIGLIIGLAVVAIGGIVVFDILVTEGDICMWFLKKVF